MARKKAREKKDLDSLIPEIKSEERHLDELLSAARAQADVMRQNAAAGAALRIREAQAALPGIVAAERDARMAFVREEASTLARSEEEKIRTLKAAASAAIDEAVAYVVSLVWPEPRQ